MKRTLFLACTALGCALALASVSAQQLRPMRGLTITQTPKVALMNAPRAYTKQQKVLALAKSMNFTLPPVLGEPVSVTPDRLYVPGLVTTLLAKIRWMSVGGPGTGVIVLDQAAGADVEFKILVQQGKHYAIDCRINSYKLAYVAGEGHPGAVTGDVATDADSHAVFATPKIQKDGRYTVRLKFTDSVGAPMEAAFWGCEISPF